MGEWSETELGEVLTLQRGFDLPKKARTPGPYPVISSSGFTGSHHEYKVEPPGVVIGRYGSIGSVHWVDEPFWPHNTSLWVKDFKGNDESFVYYLLNSMVFDGSAAAAVPGVNRNHLHQLGVVLPGLPTQVRIASVLRTFDDLIEINEWRIELLEDLAHSLCREWFVHFRFPGHTDSKFVESRLGEIPFGWSVDLLGDVMNLNYGKPLPARARIAGDVPVVSSAGIIDSHNEAVVSGPGIVVGRKGNVGSVWWVDSDFYPIDTTYFVESCLPLPFLYWVLLDVSFIDSHAAVPGLSRDQAYAIPIVIPAPSVLKEFATIVTRLRAAAEILVSQNKTMGLARDLLLPRLISGKLDISAVDLGSLTPEGTA